MPRNSGQKAAQRRALRAHAIALLGGACRLCGYDSCPEALDFHHTDPLAKDYTISGAASWKRIAKEIQKCVLLCARCHREVHAGLHPQYLADDETYRMMYSDED